MTQEILELPRAKDELVTEGSFPAGEKCLVLLDHDPIRFRPYLETLHIRDPHQSLYVYWYSNDHLEGEELSTALGELKDLVTKGVLAGYQKFSINKPLQVMEVWFNLVEEIERNKSMTLVSDVRLFGDGVENTLPNLLDQVPTAKGRVFAVTGASEEFDYVRNVCRAVGDDKWVKYEPFPPTYDSSLSDSRVRMLKKPDPTSTTGYSDLIGNA